MNSRRPGGNPVGGNRIDLALHPDPDCRERILQQLHCAHRLPRPGGSGRGHRARARDLRSCDEDGYYKAIVNAIVEAGYAVLMPGFRRHGTFNDISADGD